jgi:hypothetical protein
MGPGKTTTSVRAIKLGDAVNIHELHEELRDMNDVLLGRAPPPIDTGISTLMEVAEAYHARAREMEQYLHHAEAEGTVLRGSRQYKFRTGELRSFIELARSAMDMGSRRITTLQMELQERG